ncbi:MAG TPA: hypothetical protein VMT74_07570 [Gaiellaceae bacterium]|nr:hypothetical protein [Gaiellaceae bacterium]
MASQRLPLARFSRYVSRLLRCPAAGADPAGYLQAVADAVRRQVAALFAHGRLVAVHTSRQAGAGAGGSAAARESTRDEQAHADAERVGAELGWHGGLTLDYLADRAGRASIECNPRTVEPGNAAAAGVDLPGLPRPRRRPAPRWTPTASAPRRSRGWRGRRRTRRPWRCGARPRARV